MTTFYIARHGQTQWNVEKRLQGHMDSPLTEQGITEAEQLRNDLAKIQFDQVFSSDILRAKRTAEIVALEKNIAVKTTELLREGYYGIYEGRKVEEYLSELQKQIAEWETLSEQEKFKTTVHPSLESIESMVGRFITFIREVAVAHPQQKILVLTHGGMMRMVLIHLGFGNFEELNVHAVKNCAYFVLNSDGIEFDIKETHGIEKTIITE